MQAVANTTFEASIIDPAGDIEYLGARVEVPVTRAIVSAWRQATLTGSVWTVQLEAPVDPGEYLLVWRDGGPEPPAFEAFVPLILFDDASIEEMVFPIVDREAVAPNVDDIAQLERTRTTAGGGGDTHDMGETTFTEDTRPTADEVDALIRTAIGLVLTELPPRFPEYHYESVKHAIALYTAMLVEGSFFRERAGDEGAPLWRNLYNVALLNLQKSIERDLAEWRKLRTMEPRSSVIA